MIFIEGCKKGDRSSQQMLYKHFYGFVLGICLRYSQSEEEAVEIMNDGFMKVFTKIHLYDSGKSFEGWLKRVTVNAAIDHYRRNKKHYDKHQSLDEGYHIAVAPHVLSDMSYKDLLDTVQQLSPGYRTVFSLYVIDGYSHADIAAELGISVATSKSNLSKARANLRAILSGVKKSIKKTVYEQYT